MGRPDSPTVFTKFPSCITGPNSSVELPTGNVDWEVELVVAIGRLGRNVPEASAWDHVAGLTVGQDLSERVVQLAGPSPSSRSESPTRGSRHSVPLWSPWTNSAIRTTLSSAAGSATRSSSSAGPAT